MSDVAAIDATISVQRHPAQAVEGAAAAGEATVGRRAEAESDPMDRLLGHLMRGEIKPARALGAELAATGIEHAAETVKFVARLRKGEAMIAALTPQAGEAAAPPSRRLGSLAIAPAPGARRLILSFGGNTPQFALPLPLVCLPDTHVILIRDPLRSFSLTGIKRLGEDYANCLANLRHLIGKLGASDIYCLGISAGGYSAMKYGLDLGARGVLAFSPPTTLNLDDDPGATLAKYPQLTRLYREARPLGEDMVRLYNEAPVHPGTHVVFCRNQKRDAWLARRMRNMVGVQLEMADPQARHTTYQYYCRSGKIDAALQGLLELLPAAPAPKKQMVNRRPKAAAAVQPAQPPGLPIVSALGRYLGLRKAVRA